MEADAAEADAAEADALLLLLVDAAWAAETVYCVRSPTRQFRVS